MPIHEYFCKKCEKEFEELILSKEEKVFCPECGGSRVQKLMSSAAFRTQGRAMSHSSSGGGCSSCSASSCSSCS